jgi:hypothetical protein
MIDMSLKVKGPFGFVDRKGKTIVAYEISIAGLNPNSYESEKPNSGSVELSCYPLCSYLDRRGKESTIYSLIPFEEEKTLGPGSHVVAIKDMEYSQIRSFSHDQIPGALSSERRIFQKDGMTLFRLDDEEFHKLGSTGMGVSQKKEAPTAVPQSIYNEEKISRKEVMKEVQRAWDNRLGHKKSRFVRERPHFGMV